MNFALSDEQILLREAARGSLARFKTIEAARDALEDPSALPDLWPAAIEAGWPGLLIDEERGGAGLGAFDAMLVAEECGRVLAAVPLLGLMPAAAILNAAADESLEAIASGELRPAYLPARPPGADGDGWTGDPRSGFGRAEVARAVVDGDEAFAQGGHERRMAGQNPEGAFRTGRIDLVDVARKQFALGRHQRESELFGHDQASAAILAALALASSMVPTL